MAGLEYVIGMVVNILCVFAPVRISCRTTGNGISFGTIRKRYVPLITSRRRVRYVGVRSTRSIGNQVAVTVFVPLLKYPSATLSVGCLQGGILLALSNETVDLNVMLTFPLESFPFFGRNNDNAVRGPCTP